jgi:glycosyltransferase involved in cell wall biosynthesis
VLCVARLIPWKGVGDLLAALALLPRDVTLLVAGTGHERARQEQQALEAGLADRVRLQGDVSHAALPPLLALADVVAGASYASETFGMALVEAMGCARPVVATRFGGFPEVVKEGVTGLLVPPRDSPAMAAALLSLLDDPLRRIRFGANGRARALRLFTWPAVADRVEQAYREAISGYGSGPNDATRALHSSSATPEQP